jgi:ADP-ribose pyrophosphatase
MLPKVIKSEHGYQGRNFRVRADQVELEPGFVVKLDVVEHADSVVMLPLDDEQHIWFERQYRHPVGKTLLELPAGTSNPGEAPVETANRELQEEIGMRAEHFDELARFYLAPGYSNEFMTAFLVRGLSPSALQPDEDERIVVEKVPVSNMLSLIQTGQITDVKSLAPLLLAARRFGW